jgi:hypothetical protein
LTANLLDRKFTRPSFFYRRAKQCRTEEMSEAKKDKDPPKAEEKDGKSNVFKNDGSFLELFKKMQEEEAAKKLLDTKTPTDLSSSKPVPIAEEAPKPPAAMVGKRRGGRVLKTGQVKKPKTEEAGPSCTDVTPKDAWSAYMAEVKKYQSTTCEEEGKNRPLVK